MFIEIGLLFSSIPVGFLIAWLARDELLQGRLYISLLLYVSFFLSLVFYRSAVLVLSCGFIAVVSWISLLKSYDSRWIKERFK